MFHSVALSTLALLGYCHPIQTNSEPTSHYLPSLLSLPWQPPPSGTIQYFSFCDRYFTWPNFARFTQVGTCVRIFFLFKTRQFPTVWVMRRLLEMGPCTL